MVWHLRPLVGWLPDPAKYWLGLAFMWLMRLSRHRAGVVLMYHRIEPRRGDPLKDLSPALHRDSFEAHLRHLVKHYRVVSAAEVRSVARDRRRGARFPVAVTFDDDSRTHIDHALPLLKQFGVTATFFLNGISLGSPRAYWWELVEMARADGGRWEDVLPPEVYDRAQATTTGEASAIEISYAVQAMAPEDRRSWSDALARRLRADPEDSGIRADEIRRLRDHGFGIGFHGTNHEPLALLNEATARSELSAGRARLEQAAGCPIEMIAYPFGSVNSRVAELASAEGFRLGFTVQEVAVADHSHPLLLGRVDANIESVATFGRRLLSVLRNRDPSPTEADNLH